MTESTDNPYIIYSNELASNPTWTTICTTIYLFFRFSLDSLSNLSMATLFACDGRTCITEPGLVTKKKKLPRTYLYLLFNTL